MKTLGNALMLYSALVLISSPILYWVWSRGDWRKSAAGWHLMAYMSGLAIVMCFALASLAFRLTGNGDLPEAVRPVVWTIISFIASWRLALLFQTRYRGRR